MADYGNKRFGLDAGKNKEGEYCRGALRALPVLVSSHTCSPIPPFSVTEG
jgi:hypothetical protein